jgi:CheY-like chemotaxis protein
MRDPIRAAVLLITHDSGTRRIVGSALQRAGFHVRTAKSSAEGIDLARRDTFDLLFVDLRLPGKSATEMFSSLESALGDTPFFCFSSRGRIAAATESANRRAAVQSARSVAALYAADLPSPRSAAERWARHVLKACDSEGDLKTLEAWAECAGVSYTSLCESCRLVNVRPHAARDLARILRAVIKSGQEHSHVDVLLDVSDRRTLKALLERAGLTFGSPVGSVSVQQFFCSQQFVGNDNEGLAVLRELLGGKLKGSAVSV